MPLTLLNIGAILLLVLPGFLAYRFAVWRRADVTQRSPLWQISEMLEYSAYVHLIGALLTVGVHFILKGALGIDTHFHIAFQEGLDQFFTKHITEATTVVILYATYVIASSAIIGAYGIPLMVSSGIVKFPEWLATNVKFLRWIPVPPRIYPQEPIWYYAFNNLTENYATKAPYLMVTLKNNDAYFGQLDTYTIAPDTESEKDFLIIHAHYYRNGDLSNGQQLDSLDGIGAVLLNTVNVNSVKIYYHDQEG